MSALALNTIQQALYSKLSGDGVLMGMITGLFDAVPERTTLPYVIIGDGIERNESALGDTTARCELNVHVWTDTAGRKSALTIMNRIYGLLHHGTMSIDGFELIILQCEEAATRLEDEGAAMHGEMTFTIVVRSA
jgi:hypothetical protein